MTKEIADAFGVEPLELDKPIKIRSAVPKTIDEFTKKLIENKKEDYIVVRDNLLNLIAEVQMVVSDAAMAVRTEPSPRHFEAFSQLVHVYTSINKELLKVTTTDLKEEHSEQLDSENPRSINNAIFVGTNEALIDHIKGFTKR